ncbi:MAG TPA: hypothetical protein VMM93_11230 [Vicinamibacterales bacterium]|nr:hypothetical protein [Vicinamibacterales bacterium]
MTTRGDVGGVNDAIDRAARHLVARDAPAALRRRVGGAIAATPAAPIRSGFPWRGLAAGSASLAVATIAIALGLMLAVPELPAVERVTLATAPPASAAAVPAEARRMPVHVAALALAEPADDTMTDADAAWLERAIPALVAPASLDVAAIQPADVEIPLLSVPALVTRPVTVAPIDPARWSRER